MIVQCDKCLTRFKISDDKVRGKVVRIRCARCHQPFTVRGEEPEEKEEKKEPASKDTGLNEAPDLNDPDNGLSTPENDEPDAPSSGYNTDNEAGFSPGGLEGNYGEDTDADLTGDGPDRPEGIDKDEIGHTGKDAPAASSPGLSIDADPSATDHSAAEIENGSEQPPEDNGSPQGLSMELGSDSVLVDGEEIETPDSGDFSPDDFALDPNADKDADAFATDEFVPENAPPEDIIEDDEDSVEFDLGIGAGITIDPDLEEDGKERPFESSIEDTLAESGFGFSVEGSPDDTEEDFTMDIDEFPAPQEDEDPEFKTELPGFETEPDPEFNTGLGNEFNITVTDGADEEEDSGEAATEEIDGEPTADETDIKDLTPGLSPEDDEYANDGFGLPAGSEPEGETEDGFDLTEETETESETGGDFGFAEEPTPEDEDVFKGFADEPITDETCEDDEPYTEETDTPEEEAPETGTAEPYAREDLPSEEFTEEPAEGPAEEPIEANYNPQQPLPFETPSSPRPEMTFTPAPQTDDSGELPTAQAGNGGKKGASPGWLSLILLAIIVYGGIGALYSFGMIGPQQSKTAELSPIRVERIRGVFIENRGMGRIFTIEGRIRNFSEEPQGISMIRGVLEDGQGRVIAAKKVTPGKIISREALKTITRNELRKKLSGVPGGSIPPKGSIPVMIIFTKLPEGFAGAGVEVYRR